MGLLTSVEIHAIIATFTFILFDVLTGICVGVFVTGLSSVKSRMGVSHKMGLIMAVILGLLCHIAQQFFDLGMHLPILVCICLYITLTEIISILENIGELNPQLKNSKFMKLFAFAYDGKDSFDEEVENESQRY